MVEIGDVELLPPLLRVQWNPVGEDPTIGMVVGVDSCEIPIPLDLFPICLPDPILLVHL
jgi:hypothetical protein